MSMEHIGFVGLGTMGHPMVARIIAAGHTVTGYDVVPAAVERFRALGAKARVAASLADVGRASSVVITMLPASKEVRAATLGEGGLAACLAPGSLIIDMTSGLPTETRKIAEELAKRGIATTDAPVSGGVRRAITGDLAIMLGGNAADCDRAEPVLKPMARVIFRTGGLGSGQAMKALNNMVSAAGFVAGIEALLIGQKFGLDPGVMVDVLNASTGMNNSTQNKFRQFVLSGSYGGGFLMELMAKDLGIAMDVAKTVGVDAPLSDLTERLWQAANTELGKGADHTAIAKVMAAHAGIALEEKK
jgi:3-hydroxyisobutyrate dehydrogenase